MHGFDVKNRIVILENILYSCIWTVRVSIEAGGRAKEGHWQDLGMLQLY